MLVLAAQNAFEARLREAADQIFTEEDRQLLAQLLQSETLLKALARSFATAYNGTAEFLSIQWDTPEVASAQGALLVPPGLSFQLGDPRAGPSLIIAISLR